MKFRHILAAGALALGLFASGPAQPQNPVFAFDQTAYHIYYNEFDRFAAADFTVTLVGTTPTNALTSIDGAALLMTMAATDDSSSSLQIPANGFLFDPAKRLFFKARFRISDAVQSDFVLGLQVLDTTPLAVTDGIWFQKDDGDALLDLHVAKSSAQTDVVGIATVVTNTFMTIAYYYDPGDASIKYYVDDALVGEAAVTNAPNVQALTVSFSMQNGEAVAKTMTLDYIFAAKER